MALNFNNPVTSQDRAAVLTSIRDHITALAKMLDGESLTGTPTGAVRYSSANDQFEIWGGAAWTELPLNFLNKNTGGTLTGALVGTSGAFTSLTVGGSAVWHAGNFTPSTKQDVSTAWHTGNFTPSAKQDASTAWHTSNFDPSTKQNVATAWNTGNFDPTTKANVSGQAFTGAVSATSLAAPSLTATGASAITLFQQRDNNGIAWGWYANAGSARLWSGAADVFTVSSAGAMVASGTGSFGGNLSVTGAITATGDITAFSDERLKSSIKPYHISSDDLASLSPKRYVMFGREGAGLIAQHVQKVAPDFVSSHKLHEMPDALSIDYGKFAAVAVVSLANELRARGVI